MLEALSKDIIPLNDAERLEALHKYEILYTPAEESFDTITQMMAQVFRAPLAFISLVDKEIVYYKSQFGPFGRNMVDRKDSLCSLTILGTEPLIIEDASGEACFQENPFVATEGGIRFYAGAPLITKEGLPIGTACIVDTVPRTFSGEDKRLLVHFARLVMHEIELRFSSLQQFSIQYELDKAQTQLQAALEAGKVTPWHWDIDQNKVYTGAALASMFGINEQTISEGLPAETFIESIHPDDQELVRGRLSRSLETGADFEAEYRVLDAQKKVRWAIGRGAIQFNQEKKTSSMAGILIDVTEKKEAENTLSFRTAVLEAQNQATPDGVLLVDAKGEILLHNKRFAEIWNIPQQMLDKKDREAALRYAVNLLVDPQEYLASTSKLYSSNERLNSCEEFLFKDGRVLERRGTPIVAENGVNYGWAWYYRDITDRKKQEYRQQTLLESLPQMAWTARPDGEVDYLNTRWYEYTGQAVEEALGNGWANTLAPKAGEEIFEQWAYCLEHGTPYEVELRYRRRDGEYRWHITRAEPIKEGDKVVRWVGTCTDIHDFKELQESLELQATVLESMDEGVSVSDENGYILFTNNAEDRIFGYSPGELIGKHVTVQNYYEENENQQKVAEVLGQLKERGFWNGEWHNKRKDGTAFFTYSHITAIQIGNKTMLVCVQRDITEEKRNQEAIAYQNLLFKTTTDNATATLFMMDKTGHCTFMNAAGEKLFGYSQVEIREKPLHYLIHHHRPDGSFYPMQECPIDRALPENFDVRAHRDLFFRKDGTSFPVSCAASPIFENGVPVATVIEVRDISLEIEAEQALRRSAEELEQLVGRRTEELRVVNEQLKQFAYAASHDLQEPLRKIIFFLDLLQSNLGTSLDERNTQIMGRVLATAGRMRSLINNLLDYSNATQGTTFFQETDLNQIVEEVTSDMEVTITEKNAVLDIQQLPVIKGDERQLRQLMQNLIGNALKYSRPEVMPLVQVHYRKLLGKETGLQLSATESNTYFHVISVSDKGIGFEQKDAEIIFDVFKRLHGNTHYKGSGVGLSIVRKVVKNHNGYITAQSEPDQGATFTVFLPAN
ncbi:PAS domain S-box protein [Telluribacter sp.]|jgi:PAS domain S-box-containing protein|uniref:PAS domain S-box protein n=1 Tax=Telluribacter sp. TaxID=1978767 RepID=UPI002E0ED85B|nr:PAS domain S-box protein [Telluribacter sp.]